MIFIYRVNSCYHLYDCIPFESEDSLANLKNLYSSKHIMELVSVTKYSSEEDLLRLWLFQLYLKKLTIITSL